MAPVGRSQADLQTLKRNPCLQLTRMRKPHGMRAASLQDLPACHIAHSIWRAGTFFEHDELVGWAWRAMAMFEEIATGYFGS